MNIENKDMILQLFWLTENRFLVDNQDSSLSNVSTSQVMPCSVTCIPLVLIMEAKPLENGKILQIMDASIRYSHYAQYFSAEQAARFSKHKS